MRPEFGAEEQLYLAQLGYCRAIVHSELGEFEQSLADYDEAIRLDPSYVEAFINRGFTYLHIGRYEEAISNCNHAITLRPTLSFSYRNQGRAYARLQEYKRAITNFDKAVELPLELIL